MKLGTREKRIARPPIATRAAVLAAALCLAPLPCLLDRASGLATAQTRSAPPSDAGAEAVVPPVVLVSAPAVYPVAPPATSSGAGAIATGAAPGVPANPEVRVDILVTVSTDGLASAMEPADAQADARFVTSAKAALASWRFRPASQNGVPVAARIRVPFHFIPPIQPNTAPLVAVPTALPNATQPPAAPASDVLEVEVRGRRPVTARSTSDFVLSREILAAAPHQNAADLLQTAPGLYVARPEGDAVAHQVFLRGFDAEHGQDIAFSMGNMPLNQPSHIHGQGYADLNFLPPEVVRQVHVTEGVYDPRQGDFAVAGSVRFDLGVPASERGLLLRSTYGSFGTFRQLGVIAPRDADEETFAAFFIRQSSGFGQNRGSLGAGAIGQLAFELPKNVRGLVHVSAHGARAGLAGVLRLDDISAGNVGFYDTYNLPTATAQSANSSRLQTGLLLERPSDSGGLSTFHTYLALIDYRSRQNFTGFVERSMLRPDWVGRGDLVEQQNHELTLGALLSHRSAEIKLPSEAAKGVFEIGTSLRGSFIDQAQNLLQSPQNQTWDRRVDASMRLLAIGMYGDADITLWRRLHLRGGMRADVLTFDIDDRLGNFIPSFQRETYIVGFRRTAAGVACGPRASVEVQALPSLSLLGAYGQGYRSPQARQLAEGESAPFAKVHSGEVGFRFAPSLDGGPRGRMLTLSGSAFYTALSTDLAFDPSEGRLERIGPTSRKGLAGHLLLRPVRPIIASLSVTYVDATLDAPPAATAADPSPPYTAGQRLPYVPPLVVRADVGANTMLGRLGRHEVAAQVGIGFTFLSGRPLPYALESDAVALFDLSASLRFRFVEVGLEIFNLLDSQFGAAEYSFVSNWGTQTVPSLLPSRHISAGPPRTVLGSLSLHF